MEKSFYRFPAMAKLNEWNREQQLASIKSEVSEVKYAIDYLEYSSECVDGRTGDLRDLYGLELMDVIHATETALRMEFTDEEVSELRDAVEKKNRDRGYYGEGK